MDRRYSAFISYSHADAVFAGWLHNRLETFRFPARLVGRTTERGVVARRFAPVFRDREELAAAPSLPDRLREALRASDALIVLCSPSAAQSEWVNREIAQFRVLNPGAPILPAIIAGTPDTAFPPALLTDSEAEPLAADFQRSAGGRRLGLFKLLAGLSGIPLGELIQRDAQRRIRRVMAVTVGAVVLMLGLAAMAYLAIRSRNEAERQRNQAEGLVEFMLTDLREELRGVGRLDVMDDVNRRALDYYVAQGNLASLPPESLERRARILLAMGEDDAKRADQASARRRFAEAHRTTQEQLRRDPGNPDRIFAHGQSEYWMGYMAYLAKDFAEAEDHYRVYAALSEQLVERAPTNLGYMTEAGYAQGNLCTIYLAQKKPALQPCRAALKWMERVVAATPDEPKALENLANRHAWLADAWHQEGNVQKRIEYRLQQADIVRSLTRRFPQNVDYREFWMLTLMALAQTLYETGDGANARIHVREALGIADQLLRHDPENAFWADRRAELAKLSERVATGG